MYRVDRTCFLTYKINNEVTRPKILLTKVSTLKVTISKQNNE